jgi:molecular chaperone GrpE
MTAKTEKKNESDKRLEESEAKAQEYLDLAKRVQADFENFRKRSVKENDEFRRFAAADMASEILTVADDLERALMHANDGSLADGVRAIHSNLMKILQSRGITEIDASGKFDPNCHEALCTCDGENDNDITEVFQKGYRMDNRILRYSKVKVTKTKEKGGDEKCQE